MSDMFPNSKRTREIFEIELESGRGHTRVGDRGGKSLEGRHSGRGIRGS